MCNNFQLFSLYFLFIKGDEWESQILLDKRAWLQQCLHCNLYTGSDQSDERCTAESCGRRKAQDSHSHALAFKYSVMV